MPYREEMRNLFKQVETEHNNKLEQIVNQLRKEFDTLHRICKLLMDDLEDLDRKLTEHQSGAHDYDDTDAIMGATHKVGTLTAQVAIHEERIRQIEILLMTSAVSASAISIHNTGGTSTSVGGNIERDLIINTEKPDDPN